MSYEFNGVPFERNGNLSNLLDQQASDPAPITFQTVGPETGRQIYRDDYKDFEPRLCKAMIEERVTGAHWKFVEEIDDGAMPQIVV